MSRIRIDIHAERGQDGGRPAYDRNFRRESGPYRARKGWVFGVCGGVADYLGVNPFGVRVVTILATLFTWFWPMVIAYIVAALLMKPAPAVPLETEEDAEFYNSYTTSRSMALHRLKRTFDNLDRRIQRMEAIVTDKEYDWDRRFGEDK